MKDDRLKLIDENENPLAENNLECAIAAVYLGNELHALLESLLESLRTPKALMPPPDKNS